MYVGIGEDLQRIRQWRREDGKEDNGSISYWWWYRKIGESRWYMSPVFKIFEDAYMWPADKQQFIEELKFEHN